MFNFTTQTIFNSVVTATEDAVRQRTAAKGFNVITKDNGTKGPEVRIGNTRFNKENVLSIEKKNHTVESLAKVEFDMAEVISLVEAGGADTKVGDYRIALYLGLAMNSQDSFYANDLVYKGKPLYVEFSIKAADTPAVVAKRVKKIADKYMLFVTQEKILNVSVNETKVVIEAVNGYQLFKKAVIQKYDPNATKIDCCGSNGDFVDIMTGVPVVYTLNENTGAVVVDSARENLRTLDSDGLRGLNDDEVAIVPGLEAFGDYNWMVHNLRLPTLANTYFWSVNKSEMPVVGGNYIQYIIRMCVERDNIAGEVVGQRAKSVTTHVLYVLDQGSNKTTIENILSTLVDTIKTTADTKLAEPYASVTE